MTVQKFFQDNLEAVYKLRLGVDCLEVYNLERSAEELQRRLAEKDSELGRAEGEVDMRELQQEVMDKEEEEVSRSQVMKRKRDQPLESEETRNVREHGLKQHLSLGVLEDMPLAALTVWGIRFPEETEAVFNPSPPSPILCRLSEHRGNSSPAHSAERS